MVKVGIVGSGGREHALAWSIAQGPVDEILVMPGNAGTEQENKCRNYPVDLSTKACLDEISAIVRSEEIDSLIVGPEDPLAWGLVDKLNAEGYDWVFGPTQEQARLEASKFYSFNVMDELGVPQAGGIKCYSREGVKNAISDMATDRGVILKADILAAGKGVVVCDSLDEALERADQHVDDYGILQLVSERLVGEEFSVFAFCDGRNVVPFYASAQDHKPLEDGDKGPNTGGMGAYCPTSVAPADVISWVCQEVIGPIMEKTGYKGIFYAGMMMTEDGPKVLEINVRAGDPEIQPLVMMLQGSIYVPIALALNGELERASLDLKFGAACCTVLASNGYPGKYTKGQEIAGIEQAEQLPGVKVFHAGTRMVDGKLVNSGGRVLGVTAFSEQGLKGAIDMSYAGVDPILAQSACDFYHRTDIGQKGLDALRE
ncbi:MAG: phosphoribosylamine--glycine ligase [archaeon]